MTLSLTWSILDCQHQICCRTSLFYQYACLLYLLTSFILQEWLYGMSYTDWRRYAQKSRRYAVWHEELSEVNKKLHGKYWPSTCWTPCNPSGVELFHNNQQLQCKQDQLAMKQDQLYKLIAGERGIGSPPHTPVIHPSPSARPSPGFSRSSSISPAPVFAKSLSPSYNIFHPCLVWPRVVTTLLVLWSLTRAPLQEELLLIYRVYASVSWLN